MDLKKSFYVGLDVGNYSTKTSNTTTTSGYKQYAEKPYGAANILKYDGVYYVPTLKPLSYLKDKTSNDRCLILSLLGIAQEILLAAKNEKDVQAAITDVTDLYLGVGLPPAHMSSLSENLENYYMNHFKNGITFEYNGYNFSLTLKGLKIYPQDYAAVAVYNPKRDDFITKKFKNYYAIDIGGYTIDVVPIHSKKPVVEGCKSLERGVLKMYDQIASDINRDLGQNVDETNIEDVLRGEATCLSEETISAINKYAQSWLDEIANKLNEDGLNFDSYPVVFLGGGSKLFRKYIKANPLIKYFDFISDPRANAKGYKKLLMAELPAR